MSNKGPRRPGQTRKGATEPQTDPELREKEVGRGRHNATLRVSWLEGEERGEGDGRARSVGRERRKSERDREGEGKGREGNG